MVRIRGVSIWPQACLPAIKSDNRTTGEWLCIAERNVRDGVIRDEMTVKVEVRDDAAGLGRLKGAYREAAAFRSRAEAQRRARGRGRTDGMVEPRPRRQAEADSRSALRQEVSSVRYFDCHSHFSTRAGLHHRTAEELANAERIFKRKRTFQTEAEMAEGFRQRNVPQHPRHLPHLADDRRRRNPRLQRLRNRIRPRLIATSSMATGSPPIQR